MLDKWGLVPGDDHAAYWRLDAAVCGVRTAYGTFLPWPTPFEWKWDRGSCCRENVQWYVQTSSKAVFNPLGGGLHRVPREVGTAGGRLDLTVAEGLSGYRRAFA